MKLKKAFLLLTASLLSNAYAVTLPSKSSYDPRIQSVNYNALDVVEIRAKVGYATGLFFSESEIIEDIAVGFNDGWEVVESRNVIYLKPISVAQDENFFEPNSDWKTNLIVRTNEKVYSFDLKVTEENKDMAYKVAFNYPDKAQKAFLERQKKAQKQAEEKRLLAEQKSINKELNQLQIPENWDYSMQVGKNSRNIAPSFIYDDGKRTYFGFERASIPAIFYYQGDQEMMSNTSVTETGKYTIIRVHNVAERFILRSGEQVIGVINNGFGKAPKYNYKFKNTGANIIRELK